MIQEKEADLHANQERKGAKKGEYRKVRVNLYLTPSEFSEYAQEAEKVGLRPKQAKLFLQKKHGFSDQTIPNTKGIAKLIRQFLFPGWKKNEAERLVKKRELEKQAEELGLTFNK